MPDFSSEIVKAVEYLSEINASRACDGSVAYEALGKGEQHVKVTRVGIFSQVINLCGDGSLILHVGDGRDAQEFRDKNKVE